MSVAPLASPTAVPAPDELTNGSARAEAWRRFRRHRVAVGALWVTAALVVAVLLGPIVLGTDPEAIDLDAKGAGPSLEHPMGTDQLGRDQLVRILVGGRLTLAVGAGAVLVSMLVGVAIGAVAGYVGGFVDNALMRFVDVFYSLPWLFVVILLVTMVGPGFLTIVGAIAALSWMSTARLVRASFLSLKEKEYVEAARAIGVPGWQIAVRHVLPNALGPVIVAATVGIAMAILLESTLSFLGFGFQPPQATWGSMLEGSQRAVTELGLWWLGFFPGAMIFVTVLAVNFVGDGLRDAFDPRKAA